MRSTHAVYIGKEKERSLLRFFNAHNLFLVIQAKDVELQEEGQVVEQKLGQIISGKEVKNLADFEYLLSQGLKDVNIPSDVSLAAGYTRNNVLYLVTIGEGQIFLKRGNSLTRIIEGQNSASGHIKNGDVIVLTTHSFTDVFTRDTIKGILSSASSKNLEECVEKINKKTKEEGEGTLAFFLSFSDREEQIDKPNLFSHLQKLKDSPNKKRPITVIAIALIFFVLLWSVVFGYKRRSEAAIKKKITVAKEIIKQKIIQAEEVEFLNMSRSKVLLSEAKTELNNLKENLGSKNKKDIEELENLIKEGENKITKKEEKVPEEFFDLAVDNKQARGTKLGIDKDTLVILNPAGSTIYLLSLSKKSLDKKTASSLKRASLTQVYNHDLFFFVPSEGMYKFSDGNEAKKIIDNDSEWGDIQDFVIYNGNIYLLDTRKGQIYKYMVAENGYSAKSSYIKDDQPSLSETSSIAIDSSVYISLSDRVLKYVSGARDGFQTEFPEEVDGLTKVITRTDLDKVYLWDKKKGVLYIVEKSGTYVKQLQSNALTKADDITIFDNQAYLLIKEKIYSLRME